MTRDGGRIEEGEGRSNERVCQEGRERVVEGGLGPMEYKNK